LIDHRAVGCEGHRRRKFADCELFGMPHSRIRAEDEADQAFPIDGATGADFDEVRADPSLKLRS